MNLFSVCIFVELVARVRGVFATVTRFLNETACVTGDETFQNIAATSHESGTLFSAIGRPFRTAETAADVDARVGTANENLENVAKIHQGAFERLEEIVFVMMKIAGVHSKRR